MMADLEEESKVPPVDSSFVDTHFKYKNPGRSAFAQLLATFLQNFLLIEIGMDILMTTVVLGSLYKNPAEPLSMDDDQASWYGSIPNFFHPFASFMSGFFQEKFGRKGAMMIVNIPIFIAWMTLYSAQSIYSLYIVNMIMGITTGLSEAPLHSYIGEIGEPHMRGTLSTISTACGIIGTVIVCALGYLFDWRTVALLSSSCSIITFISMTQIPESPTWLIVRGRFDEARKSLCWLRGWVSPDEVEEEFQALVRYTKSNLKQNIRGSTKSDIADNGGPQAREYGFFKRELNEIKSRKVLRPLRMQFILFTISGIATLEGVLPFLIGELKRVGSPIEPKLLLVIFFVLLFAGTMMNVVFLRRFGKRKIALFSHLVVAASIFSIGACNALQLGTKQNVLLSWILIILWMDISFFKGFSTMTLPWQFLCEAFPPGGRGTATGIGAAWAHLVHSILAKSYLYTVAWIGFSGVMYLYSVVTMLGLVYIYFFLPETEGKSLEQIGTYFTENCDRKEMFSMGKTRKNAGKNNKGFVRTE